MVAGPHEQQAQMKALTTRQAKLVLGLFLLVLVGFGVEPSLLFLTGGLIGWLGNCYFAKRLWQGVGAKQPKLMLAGVYKAETIKLVAVSLGLALAGLAYPGYVLWLMGGYLLMPLSSFVFGCRSFNHVRVMNHG